MLPGYDALVADKVVSINHAHLQTAQQHSSIAYLLDMGSTSLSRLKSCPNTI